MLPAALRGVRKLIEGEPGPPAGNAGVGEIAMAREKLTALTGIGLMLRHQATRVTHAFREAGIEGVVVKGAVAAQRLYPEASLRTFTDVDVLMRRAPRGGLRVLRGLGFDLFTFADRSAGTTRRISGC